MLQNILTLSDTTVDEIMIHRSNIFSINIDDSIIKITKKISESKFTRIPIWKNVQENIIGILDNDNFIINSNNCKMYENLADIISTMYEFNSKTLGKNYSYEYIFLYKSKHKFEII